MDNFRIYLRTLYKKRSLVRLCHASIRMHKVFPGSSLPLEWLCKVYLEWCAGAIENPADHTMLEKEIFGINVSPPISSYIAMLSNISESSTLAKLAKGASAYQNGNFTEARTIITRTFNESEKSTTNFYATYILCKCHDTLSDGYGSLLVGCEECEDYICTAKVLLDEKVKHVATRDKIREEIDDMHLKYLYRQLKLTEAVKILESKQLNSPTSYARLILYAKIYACYGDRASVQKLMEGQHEVVPFHKLLINSMLLRTEGCLQKALKTLNDCDVSVQTETNDKFETILLRGQLLWELKQPLKSLPDFLTSAKLDPHSWVPFLYLGHFYYKIEEKRDLEKSIKCYKKCLSLSPTNSEAGAMLSDIYRSQGKWEENLIFLSSVAQSNLAGSKLQNHRNSWAYLRLGMHYLACENYSLAIQNLQSVLRSDPSNIDAWESLADAYASRGSYKAALKAYDKTIRLEEELHHNESRRNVIGLYARLQIATIKHKLGHYADAVSDLTGMLQEVSDYVPALKILGETMLDQAKDFLEQGLSKNAIDNCQRALGHLTVAVKSSKTDLSCIWFLMGRACLMINPISDEIVSSSRFAIPNELLLPSESVSDKECRTTNANKLTVLKLATKCFTRSLQIQPDNANSWHNLALSYYAQSQEEENSGVSMPENRKDLKQRCVISIKRAIQIEPKAFVHWNALGLFEMYGENLHEDSNAKSLAQHAFITSIETENNAISWTNLGILYLISNEFKLANKAFKEAQNQDPSYINCWVGQALLAEIGGVDEEAMDLFRHTTILGNEPESAAGYANWICKTVLRIFNEESNKQMDNHEDIQRNDHSRYCIENMYGVTVATDCLLQYVDKIKDDPCILNMLGILLEKERLLKNSKEILKKALNLVIDGVNGVVLQPEETLQYSDKIRQNLGRVLFKLKEYKESEKQFTLVTSRDFYGQIGLALSASKNNTPPQDVYNAYTVALEMAQEDKLRSQVLAAMATIAYKVQGGEASKTLLFQSCQLQPPSVNSLFALLVLGLKQSDPNLVGAALSEIDRFIKNQPINQVQKHLSDITWLKSLVLVIQGKHNEAKVAISKEMFLNPHIFGLWRVMALQLLSTGDRKFASIAAKCALKSEEMKLASSNRDELFDFNNAHNEDVTSLALVAYCLASAGKAKRKEAIKAASKAVHTYPYLTETWTILLAVLSGVKHEQPDQENSLLQMKIGLSAKIILTTNISEHKKNNYHELSRWITNLL